MIILVGGTKGGGGKTTIAINLLIAMANDGKDVCLVDGDRIKTASKWIDMRSDSINKSKEKLPLIDCYEKSGRIHDTLESLDKKYEYVIADCGGYDSTELRSGLVVSDLFLVPQITEQTDIWSLQELLEVINTVEPFRKKGELIGRVILSQVDTNPKVKSKVEFEELISDSGYEKLMLTGLHTSRRRSYPKAVPLGKGVVELSPPDRDEKAIKEINNIKQYVYTYKKSLKKDKALAKSK